MEHLSYQCHFEQQQAAVFNTHTHRNSDKPTETTFSASDRQTATRWWTYCIVEHLAAKLPDFSLWTWWGPNTELKGEWILDICQKHKGTLCRMLQRACSSQCEPYQDPGPHRRNSFSQRCTSSTPLAHSRVPQASGEAAALSNNGLRGWSRYLLWQLGGKGQWRFLQQANTAILHSHKDH